MRIAERGGREGLNDDAAPKPQRREGGGRSGQISLDALGPANEGTMVVTAARSDVRRCRSTGCSIVGYLERGQVVDVHDFAGRWYRVAVDGEAAGYVLAEHLQLPLVSQIEFLGVIAERTATFYAGNLKGLTARSEPVFSGYELEFEADVLDFEFYTPFRDGSALSAICDAMRGIADSNSSATTRSAPAGRSVGSALSSVARAMM